jgi:hypothetical protein
MADSNGQTHQSPKLASNEAKRAVPLEIADGTRRSKRAKYTPIAW